MKKIKIFHKKPLSLSTIVDFFILINWFLNFYKLKIIKFNNFFLEKRLRDVVFDLFLLQFSDLNLKTTQKDVIT